MSDPGSGSAPLESAVAKALRVALKALDERATNARWMLTDQTVYGIVDPNGLRRSLQRDEDASGVLHGALRTPDPSTQRSQRAGGCSDAHGDQAQPDDLYRLLDESGTLFCTACGVLMVRLDVSSQDAAQYLVRTALDLGVEQTELAAMIVGGCTRRGRRCA